MLLVEINSSLNGLVSYNISMGKVFRNDTGTWFLFLCDLIAVTLSVVGIVASIIFSRSASAGDFDLGRSELSVVEEEGSLSRGFLFESYSGRSILDFETGDFPTMEVLAALSMEMEMKSKLNLPEREEIANFFLARSRADVLDVDGVSRHDCCFVCLYDGSLIEV